MGKVMTVLGQLLPEKLGHCQIHEHIFVRPTPASEKNPVLCIDSYDRSLAELKAYRQAGGQTIVDAQPVAAGRDAAVLERLSAESGVNIIASTGFHLLGFYTPDCWIHRLGEDELFELFKTELEEGMLHWSAVPAEMPEGRSRIRAGIVKAAIPADGPVGRYETLLRAGARAAAYGGVPLMLHTEYGGHAEKAAEICFGLGVKPEKLIVCHVDRQAKDMSVHDSIAALGVWLDYDTVGRFKYHDDASELALLRHAEEKGYADRVLLALDTTAARLSAYGGEIGLDYIFTSFIPLLRQAGLSEERIRGFNHENCRRLFAG